MTLLKIPPKRTKAHANHGQMSKTHQGMAHFAGTGPSGMNCRRCSWFDYNGDKPSVQQICSKFTRLMQGKPGKKIPPTAAACKYFEEGRK